MCPKVLMKLKFVICHISYNPHLLCKVLGECDKSSISLSSTPRGEAVVGLIGIILISFTAFTL